MTLEANGREWNNAGSFSGFEGRQWLQAAASLPSSTTDLRWRYATDPLYEGRGVYLDGVRVFDPGGLVFDGERSSDAALWLADGWTASRT